MPLEYAKIFRQAFALTKTYRFLWFFGLFLIWGGLINIGYTFSTPSRLLQAGFIFLLVILILLVWIVLYFRAKAGSIIAIKAILDRSETSFKKSFAASKLFYWRLLGISLLLGIIISIVILIISTPIFYMISNHFIIRAVVLIVLGLAVLLPSAVVITLAYQIAPLFVVLYDLKIGEAISSSFAVIAKFWNRLLIFGLMLLCLSIIVFFLTAVIIMFSALPFVYLAFLTYHKMSMAITYSLAAVGIIVGLIVFLTIQSAMAIFTQASWVLAFLELVKPQRFEEEEIVAEKQGSIIN